MAVLAAVALVTSGCVTLLPKAKPVDLYRFGQPASAQVKIVQTGTVGVVRATGGFQREAAGDRLVAITSEKVALIAEARWVTPAVTLWDAAVLAAFDADNGRVRLIARGEPGRAAYVLRLDVRNFEALYERGPKAAPTVLVRVRAALTSNTDRGLIDARIFEARITPSDNKLSEIVPAYDRAVAEVLKQVIGWTNELAVPV
jgi:cholesterol transport system auxiliary component